MPFSLTRKERKILTVLLTLFLLGLLGMAVLDEPDDTELPAGSEGYSRPVLPASTQFGA